MRPLLVTGAAGLLGAAVVARAEGAVGVARADGDLALPGVAARLIRESGAVDIVHCAGRATPHGEDDEAAWAADVSAVEHLLEVFRNPPQGYVPERPARVVLLSSAQAAGPGHPQPLREDVVPAPANAYGASRLEIERLAAAAHGGPRVAVVRVANVYGAGDRNASRLVPELLDAALAGRAPRLGALSAARDFLWAGDAAEALLDVLAALGEDGSVVPGEVLHAGAGVPVSVGEMAQLVGELAGAEWTLSDVDEGAGDAQWLDVARLRERTGWRARTSLREGLSRSLQGERELRAVRP